MKGTNPQLKLQIEIIEKFLAQLEEFILYPKIVQVPVEKIVEKVVEKDKVVTVPTQDERSIKMYEIRFFFQRTQALTPIMCSLPSIRKTLV